jgi:EAL domain-containing protein (putative c-di-GMP-specific phosphodiesterase class I)
MACGLSSPTVGEDVENQATLDVVRELGIDFAQGNHVGCPVSLYPRP